jgi:CubicO group peptidase (beta-lactamase class C family)/D-alanyl-D-alanine dipeptidase
VTATSRPRQFGRASRAARAVALVACTVATWPAVARAVQATTPTPADSARYAPAVARLDSFVAREVAAKRLPGLSIALVDDQRVVWERGFGQATAGSVHRVGSVSKLFTDLAVMQLVERGVLDLDAPVSRYLPDFRPGGARATRDTAPITLRHLMSHRAGLVREPPAGHYFDSSGTTLAATVASLNGTGLVYPVGARTKYSNAAIAVVGHVLERTRGEPFADYLRRAVLQPMGLRESAFVPEPALAARLAPAFMWSYEGKQWAAPTFQLGMAPAGSMYTTVGDLARFMSVLFAGGRGPAGPVLRTETLQQMWTPQFAAPGARGGFGIGFALSELQGRRRVAHGGAIYGFSTELAALPDEKLGVVVVATLDGANAVVERIAEGALQLMLAAREGRPLPVLDATQPLAPGRARRLAGRYGTGDAGLDLEEFGGRLYLMPVRGGFRTELRARGDTLVVDDRLAYGATLLPLGEGTLVARAGRDTLRRVASPMPAAAADAMRALVGEYGWDYNKLYLLERDGRLNALIEWFYQYPLTEVSRDVYAFPAWGLYDGERLQVRRDASSRVTEVIAAGVRFPRRAAGTEDGSTFTITPQRPVAELRAEALAARPPQEAGPFRASELVPVTAVDPSIRLDVRYATTNNFMRAAFYSSPRAYLQRPAAEALARANRALRPLGYGLLVHDAYRPWYVTKMFWEGTPAAQRVFVADPSQGSRHNRGAAVDLTLLDLRTNRPIEMTGGYDEFSDRSYPSYPGGTSRQRWHRDLLRRTMEAEGFTVFEAEWWHFDFDAWRQFPIGTATFEEIERTAGARRGGGR